MRGPGAADFVNACLTNDLRRIHPGKAQYTLCCADDGGVIDDMIVPKEKDQVINESLRDVGEVEKQYRRGIITDGERYNKIIDIWAKASEDIAQEIRSPIIHAMCARGS